VLADDNPAPESPYNQRSLLHRFGLRLLQAHEIAVAALVLYALADADAMHAVTGPIVAVGTAAVEVPGLD
jgi:hypothetical protein